MKKLFNILFDDLEGTIIKGLALGIVLSIIAVLIVAVAATIKVLIITFNEWSLSIMLFIGVGISLFLFFFILGNIVKILSYIWEKFTDKSGAKKNKDKKGENDEEIME